jgi:molecular chaperone IbpA
MAFDFSPLYRSTIGFDGMTALFAHALNREEGGFPPYNIQKVGENTYRIAIALAGWSQDDLELIADANRLVVRGRPKPVNEPKTYLHRGLAQRAFERLFDLADYVEITGASMSDGLLNIDLKREIPEVLKPRRIEIATQVSAQVTSLDERRAEKSAA